MPGMLGKPSPPPAPVIDKAAEETKRIEQVQQARAIAEQQLQEQGRYRSQFRTTGLRI